MEEADKGWLMITIRASGWMFLLVLGHLGCPRQNPESRKLVACCLCLLITASPSLRTTYWLRKGRSHFVVHFKLLGPKKYLEWLRLETSNFVHWLTMWTVSCGMTVCRPSGHAHGHVISLNFGKSAITAQKWCKIKMLLLPATTKWYTRSI